MKCKGVTNSPLLDELQIWQKVWIMFEQPQEAFSTAWWNTEVVLHETHALRWRIVFCWFRVMLIYKCLARLCVIDCPFPMTSSVFSFHLGKSRLWLNFFSCFTLSWYQSNLIDSQSFFSFVCMCVYLYVSRVNRTTMNDARTVEFCVFSLATSDLITRLIFVRNPKLY